MSNGETTTLPSPSAAALIAELGRVWSSADPADLGDLYAEDTTYVEGAMDATYRGLAGLQRFARFMLRFSSDSDIVFTRLVRDGRAFAAEWVWSGTADGPLVWPDGRIAATGLRYSVPGVAFCLLDDDGRVAHHKDYYDFTTLLRQIRGEQEAADIPDTSTSEGDNE